MGWTAPRTWVVGEIVTAALMNTHVRDDLRYLKGLDGDVTIEDDIILATGKALQTATGAGNTLLVQAYDTDTGPAYQTFITLTAGGTPSCELDACILDTAVAKGTWTASGTWTIPAVTLGGTITASGQTITGIGALLANDDALVKMGADNDQVMLNRSTVLNADTGLASVLIGTPESQGIAANSLIISNVTASGDIAFYVNKAGASQMTLWFDGSSGDTAVMAASGASVDHYIAGVKVLDHASGAFAFQESTVISTSVGTLQIDAKTYGFLSSQATDQFTGFAGSDLASGSGAQVWAYGNSHATKAGVFEVYTPNPSKNADIIRLLISGNLDTAVVTWSNATHSGIVTTDATNIEIGAAGAIKSGATNGDTWLLKANDTTFITFTTGATDLCEIDNTTLDTCVAKGTWTASGTWTIPAVTAGGAVTLGGQSISGTNFTLKTSVATDLVVRNAADDADGNLGLRSLLPSLNIDFQTDGALIRALGSDGAYFAIQARDTGVGFVEIARAVGAADAYFQATLPLRFSPIATASLPGTPVEGMITYDATLDRITYRDASAWAVITKEGHGPAEHADQTRELFISAGSGVPASGATLDPDAVALPVITLTDAADETAGFGFKVPDDFVSYTSLQVVWKSSAASGNMNWAVDAVWNASTEEWATTAEVGVVGVTATGGAGIVNVQAPNDPVVFSGLAIGDYISISVTRTATHANDTLSADVQIMGILFTYTASQ